ncbi:alpha/beta fold hydrolase [Leucobacter tardus]|uniref:Alpha/beta fold hydrolase n=1 Tax=Leucobacter tardus TaxID=501483 RepID=A0A939TNU0_9MICO|nr:alpha/beta fold hydrolase [Leucobacter tardus]
MSRRASLPPEGLPGLDASWSRIVSVPGRADDAGRTREWHLLDTGAELERRGHTPRGTILAVHGNPTWSYLWRSLAAATLDAADAGAVPWRVIAVDQLDMGFSDRTGRSRTLAQRVADLTGLTDALDIAGPVVTLGHDWGGVVSLGWAVDHPEQTAAVAVLNTAVHHPADRPIPAPLRLAGLRGVLETSTVATSGFLDTVLGLAEPSLDPEVRRAFRSPYLTADRRGGIGAFVADIPADPDHPSFPELERIADGVAALRVPALMLWGPKDPIFSDRYLDDLVDRLPHADVHRFEGAGHLIAEERPYAAAMLNWLEDRRPDTSSATPDPQFALTDDAAAAAPFVPLWAGLDARAGDPDAAIIDMSARGGRDAVRVSWALLDTQVRRIAAGLHRIGVRAGDRVSLLVQPGPTLTAVTYACLRIGAVVVVADAGLGIRGLTRAVRGAWPDVIIGERTGLAASRVLGWPGIRISAERLARPVAAALGVSHCLADIAAHGMADLGSGADTPPEPTADDPAAILFTSGSTGPAKGVRYTHGQLSALRDVLAQHLDVCADSGLVTGFAPFALLGPALSTRSATPDMNVSAPRTLTARAVAAAVRECDAAIVFLSPAAILNVVATASALTAADREALAGVRTVLSTGAPIGAALLTSIAELMPHATPHTPYGMTECLLVSDITLDGVHEAAAVADDGVCVGKPIGENRVLISALDDDGRATGEPDDAPGRLGEIIISAPHLKQGYDRLWLTDREAVRGTAFEASPGDDSTASRWHRTGDVGHFDERGRLWVEGRVPHVIVTATGPVAPVGPEQAIESVAAVRRAAVVGVGPRGVQQLVAVVETVSQTRRPGLASPELTDEVRAATAMPIAAVYAVPQLPTDIRHNSKIDRSRLAAWAEGSLAGRTTGTP